MRIKSISEITAIATGIKADKDGCEELWFAVYDRVGVQLRRRMRGYQCYDDMPDMIGDAACEIMEALLLASYYDDHFIARLFLAAEQRVVNRQMSRTKKEILKDLSGRTG